MTFKLKFLQIQIILKNEIRYQTHKYSTCKGATEEFSRDSRRDLQNLRSINLSNLWR
jgi:hypothetical protein